MVLLNKKNIEVYAHRGTRSFAPENSMPGYKTCLRIGTNWVDMDIVVTKDGEVVVSHDIWLNPDIVRDNNGKFLAKNKSDLVKNLTLEQLQQYDIGKINPDSEYSKYFPEQFSINKTYIPTLRQVIRYVNKVTNGKVGFQIEFKTDPEHPDWTPKPSEFAIILYKVLKEEGITKNCEIQSFDWRCLYELQKLDHEVKTAYLTDKANNSIPQMVKALGGTCWEPEDVELTKESLDEAHKLGLKVVVWTWPEHIGTAFDSKLIKKMIDWGVDGIITDDPGQLISMLAARGYNIPQRYNAY